MSPLLRFAPPFLRRLLAALTALCCLFSATPGLAQGNSVSEYAMKSALLFKLPQFVYRPETPKEAGLGMCVLGRNPFGGALERLAQTPIDGRTVRIGKAATVQELAGCDFVFIARSEAENLEVLLRRLSNLPVVTVSDIEGFARTGGMVELAAGGEGAAVGILVNRRAAKRHNIEFNAQLLRLARVIE